VLVLGESLEPPVEDDGLLEDVEPGEVEEVEALPPMEPGLDEPVEPMPLVLEVVPPP
jgi:hypothetical protein